MFQTKKVPLGPISGHPGITHGSRAHPQFGGSGSEGRLRVEHGFCMAAWLQPAEHANSKQTEWVAAPSGTRVQMDFGSFIIKTLGSTSVGYSGVKSSSSVRMGNASGEAAAGVNAVKIGKWALHWAWAVVCLVKTRRSCLYN